MNNLSSEQQSRRQHQQAVDFGCLECKQLSLSLSQQLLHGSNRAVPKPQPHDFRWATLDEQSIDEVGVLRDDDQTDALGCVPDLLIAEATQAQICRSSRLRVQIGEARS